MTLTNVKQDHKSNVVITCQLSYQGCYLNLQYSLVCDTV